MRFIVVSNLLSMDRKYKRLLGNTVWTLAGNTGSKILAFLLLPFYTRWLGTDGYGLSDLIYTYSSLMLGVITLCTADGIFVFVKNKEKKEQQDYFTSTILFTIGMFIVWGGILGVLDLMARECSMNNTFTHYSWFIFFLVFTTFLQNYTQQFILSIDKIKIYSFTGMVLCLTTFLLSWLLIPIKGVAGYIYSIVFANLITALYSFIVSKSYRYINVQGCDYKKVKELLKYSIPLIPNTIMWWLVGTLNRPLMESYLGLSGVGIYAVANKFPSIITMIFALFSVSWNISVFEEYHKPGYESYYTKIFKMFFLGLSILSILLMLISPLLISVFASPEFYEAWKYMVVLILGAFFSCMSAFWGTTFSVVKESKYLFYSSIWGALISIVLNILMIPTLGLYGACISVVSSFFVMALSRYFYNKKFVAVSLLKDIIIHSTFLIVICILLECVDNTLSQIAIAVISIGLLLVIYKEQISPLRYVIMKKII